jgi:enoyl-CoA hydratase/3-hydroxyacyl-CoA dehydrogenase
VNLNLDDVETIAVVGAGTLGHGIAAVTALAGYEVRLRDISEEAARAGHRDVEQSLEGLVEQGRIGDEAAAAALDRVTTLVDLEAAVDDADVVVEAVPEKPEVKKNLYRELAGIAPDRAVFATNTSALSVTDLSKATDRPERFCGMHFFNPPTRMELVEVVAGAHTDEATLELAAELAAAMDKTPIRVGDSPGFVVNRVLFPMLDEAAWMVHEGEVDVETVDAAARDELGLPMGVSDLVAHVGIDVVTQVLDSLHERLGDAYRPCPLLVEYAKANPERSDAGLDEYASAETSTERGPGDGEAQPPEFVARRLRAVAANETAKLIAADVADAATVDRALALGTGFPEGPAEAADRVGIAALYGTLAERRNQTGTPRYEPAEGLARLVARGETFHDTATRREGTATESGRGTRGGEESGDDGFDTVDIERRAGGVGHVVLDRPDRLNTISPAVLDDLAAAVERLEDDDDVRALLVTGAGEAFSAGADVRAIAADVEPMEAADLARRGQSVFGRLEACPMPVVAGVQGYCLGGGIELATACDLRIGGREATFGQPEHDLGLLPGFGGTQRLARLIGEGRAREVIFTAQRYGAERMAEYGFLTEVVETGDVRDRALELARDLAAGPPLAQALTKRAMRAGRDGADAGLEVEAQAFGHLVGTADAAEGISAFFDDRDPEFEGE